MASYMMAIDQSTSGTKAMLFDQNGDIVKRTDLPHRQIIDSRGWVEHAPMEIYRNTVQVMKTVIEETGIDKSEIAGLGISNQRETALMWNRETGEPVYNAVVWQCARGTAICDRLEKTGIAPSVREKTGLNLSPYFSAAKLAWIVENVPGVKELGEEGKLCAGTIDAWLVFKLTGGKVFKTDYSNACRTQLFNIRTLSWDPDLCEVFGIPMSALGEVTDSNGDYGETDLEGFLPKPIPIRGVLGDSHAALFGQGCHRKGMIKATYGTGSSVMMNIGDAVGKDIDGVVNSIGYVMDGKVSYVYEGNINYTGATIKWLTDDVKLIENAGEATELSYAANPEDTSYIVPAFSGLGAPYFANDARAAIVGMTRNTGKAEIVRAAVESIAYQITDILNVMRESAGIPIAELRVDGGPTRNTYLMQFQSDMAGIPVRVPNAEELSGIGACYAAGIALGFYGPEVFDRPAKAAYSPQMAEKVRDARYAGWKKAVGMVIG